MAYRANKLIAVSTGKTISRRTVLPSSGGGRGTTYEVDRGAVLTQYTFEVALSDRADAEALQAQVKGQLAEVTVENLAGVQVTGKLISVSYRDVDGTEDLVESVTVTLERLE